MELAHQKSIEAHLKSYSRGMYNLCLRMLNNKQDAEDVLQEAFCKAYVNLKKLKDHASFGAWLKRIVVNECLKFLKSRIHFADIDVADQELDSDFVQNELSLQIINDEIRKLPDGCRVVFTLYLLEDYAHKQIAELMNISESTSKSQYQRARQLLQKQLKTRLQNG